MHRNKKRTTVNLPEKLHERAKAEGFNLSKLLENAIKRKLGFYRSQSKLSYGAGVAESGIALASSAGGPFGPSRFKS